ncbi:HYR domain-containing protein [Mangrovivirga cuniculi]|uniref:HYR domain-containing protein n=1 Tax=Mangrovivirga cuniculi TaxID=2715131 RepID=UPI001586B1D3|nr:HYR domain-containing protein [Mangrovivirga cuniculi]
MQSNVKGNCIVDFNNNSHLKISNTCSLPIQNLELGKNISLSTSDSFTFDAPEDIFIDGSLKLFSSGNGQVIIPSGVHVYIKGNLHAESADSQCEAGNPCSLSFVINGSLTVEGNLHNKINELKWEGIGTVNVLSNFDNTNSGCMNCGNTCPAFNDNGSCKDDGNCSEDFCITNYGSEAIKKADTEPPVFEYCPGNQTIYTSETGCTATAGWSDPIVSDNSGTFTLNSNIEKGSILEKGFHTVTYTATDEAGNSSTCSFSIIVSDNIFPSYNTSCPNDIYREGYQSISWTEPKFTDNCSISRVERSHNPGDYFNVGSHVVTYKAYDESNNLTTCSFNIIVQGVSGPEITYCPNDVIVSVNSNCESQAFWNEPEGDFENIFSKTQNFYSGDIFPLGRTNVEYIYTDIQGASVCSFDIIVKDDTPPVINGIPNDIIINTDKRGSAVTWADPTVVDNCAATLFSSHKPNDNFPEGKTLVRYTATDNSQNKTTEEFTVSIVVNHPPIIQNDTLEVIKSDRVEVCPVISDPDQDNIFINDYSINSTGGQITNRTQANQCLEISTVDLQSQYSKVNIEVCDDGIPALCTSGEFTVKFLPQEDVSSNIKPYKIFTPDNDTYNDVWIIENIESYPDNRVSIFDRWGRVVYEATGYNNTSVVFNGKSNSSGNNADVPTDTYFYNIVIGNNIKIQGYVELLR